MITRIPTDEFIDMIPADLLQLCREHNYTDQNLMDICETWGNLRSGISESCNITQFRLEALDLRSTRFTRASNGYTFLIKFKEHNLDVLRYEWSVDLTGDDLNVISHLNGKFTWRICRAEDKVMPKAYKEYLKSKFEKLNTSCLNKLTDYIDRYVKAYNTIYQRELDKQSALA